MAEDTIYALSTPLGNGIAVVRVSGPRANFALTSLFSHHGAYESHRLYHGEIRNQGELIDDAMAVLMRTPHSYTGEDCAEFHCHGSFAVVQKLMQCLDDLGLRIAQPGEFSKRAFLNGKMDLSQAEAVMDLIHAQSEHAAKSALLQLKGRLSQEISKLQDDLTNIIAQVEAGIDYPEEDWQSDVCRQASNSAQVAMEKAQSLLQRGRQGSLIREGIRVTLVGRPNVGKSTLFNALLDMQRAIVTDVPGTTRDVIEEGLLIGGLLIRLMDTAGLRETQDTVEKIGIALTRERMMQADIVLVLIDASGELTAEDTALLDETKDLKRMILLTKQDKVSDHNLRVMLERYFLDSNQECPAIVAISAQNHSGFEALEQALLSSLSINISQDNSDILSNQRHISALQVSVNALNDAIAALNLEDMDCASIDLRAAWHSLGEITGTTIDETIVDRIFSTFCLGK